MDQRVGPNTQRKIRLYLLLNLSEITPTVWIKSDIQRTKIDKVIIKITQPQKIQTQNTVKGGGMRNLRDSY